MNVERAGSIVKDLRGALRDGVAPDLKLMVRGLADVKEGIVQPREEMKAGSAQLREEIAAVERRSVERQGVSDRRFAERLESLDCGRRSASPVFTTK